MSQFKIVFMGTPDFSTKPLLSLIEAGHEVVAVYTQPPRPAGRGEKLRKSPVHELAESKGIPVFTPTSLKTLEAQEEFESHQADIAVVVAYGIILPKEILEASRLGCLNIHASLLPRWRGAAPIQRAIEAGDRETGITIMQMDEGLDTGDMLLKGSVEITPQTTGQSLHDELADLGADLIVKALEQDKLIPETQPDEGVTYAKKLSRSESHVDWTKSAEEIERTLRAFTPWPGLYFTHNKKRIKLLEVEVSDGGGSPGQTLDDALTVACGMGALKILKLQKEGKAPVDAQAFLNGTPVPQGAQFE